MSWSSAAVLGMVLSLGRRRLRMARGVQAGMENVGDRSLKEVAVTGDKGEAEEESDDTMLEMLRLKVTGSSLEHRQEGELTEA